jgi:hypothetical protein
MHRLLPRVFVVVPLPITGSSLVPVTFDFANQYAPDRQLEESPSPSSPLSPYPIDPKPIQEAMA